MKKKLLLLFILLPILLFGISSSYDLDGAVGFWSLNENDASSTTIFNKFKNDGTSANTPVFTYDQNGVPNQAMDLVAASTDKITPANSTDLGTVHTTAGWFKLSNITDGFLSLIGSSNDYGILFATFASNSTLWYSDATNDVSVSWTHDTNWHHFAMVRNGTSVDFYLDGLQQGSTQTLAGNISRDEIWVIGSRNSTANYFNGTLSDIAIYPEAKDQTWIDSQYLAGQTTSGIVADGTNLVTNGTFDTDSDWTHTGDTVPTISGGTANFNNVGDNGYLLQNGVIENNKNYLVSFEITSYTSGTLNVYVAGAGTPQRIGQYTSAGKYVESVTEGIDFIYDNSSVRFYALVGVNNGFVGSIDNVVVTDITNQQVSTLTQNLAFDMPMTVPNTKSSPTKDSGSLTVDRKYIITAQDGEDFTADGSPDNNVGTIFVATGTNVTLDSNDTVKEMNATTLDLSSNNNNGTVSGAKATYDGLVNAGAGIAYIPSTVAYGQWEFDLYKGGAGNFAYVRFISATTGWPNSWTLGIQDDESIWIIDAGTAKFKSVASYVSINTWYSFKITRSDNNDFTTYVKGGAFGWDDWTTVVADTGSNPFNDVSSPTSVLLTLDMDAGDEVRNLKINGKPISLSDATQSTGTWTTTKPSYYYDGNNVIYLDTSLNDVWNGDWTFSFWTKPDDGQPVGDEYFSGDYTDVTGRHQFKHITDGKIRLYFEGNSDNTAEKTDSAVFPNGTTDWTHISVTGNQSTTEIVIYINGILEPSTATGSITSGNWALYNSTTAKYYFADFDDASGTYAGNIAEYRIWNEVRSTTKIMQEYNRKRHIYQ